MQDIRLMVQSLEDRVCSRRMFLFLVHVLMQGHALQCKRHENDIHLGEAQRQQLHDSLAKVTEEAQGCVHVSMAAKKKFGY